MDGNRYVEMAIKTKLDSLEARAIKSGFKVERDDSSMFIKSDGFGYCFRTDIEDEMLTDMIQDAESFMRDILRMREEGK